MAGGEDLYLRLPIPLQNLACNWRGWQNYRSRFGGEFQSLLEGAEARTFWPVEQIKMYRDQRLQAFIQHCARTVPYYRRQFKEYGISPEDIRTLEDLARLPILTKQEVQENIADLISEAVPKREQIAASTSGTTGGALRFITTQSAVREIWAIWWRYRRWHGLELDIWSGHFGGRVVVPLSQSQPPFWRYNYPGKQVLFSAYHMMKPDNLPAYIEELRKKQPPWLHGYPSLLSLLAAYVLETGNDLGYKPRWITVGAENLLAQQVELIERAFMVRPRQHYGLSEGVGNISECEHGTLHVDEDYSALEFIPSQNQSGYRLVGTNFTNLATPLIRYDSQDVVMLPDGEATCQCGRPGRIVSHIDGRQEDYIVLKDGTRLGLLDLIFKDMVNVREAQIYQERVGEVTLRVVRGEQYTEEDEIKLMHEAQNWIGKESSITISYEQSLERSRTGKLRFVIRNM